jgi:hypothetical protein
MDPLKRIAELLDEQSPRKRIAAAVVLGELKVKDPAVIARLVTMASDPLEAFAEAALEALGSIGSTRALPVLFDALGRKGLQAMAQKAIAAFGEEALPEIRSRLENASGDERAQLSQLLPAMGGRQSLELALEEMRGQSWDLINKIALTIRQESKTLSVADRKVMRTQVERFLDKKRTADDELALRGALKVLGFLELEESLDTLLPYLSAREPTAVRVEAVTALRFALAGGASKKAVRKLIEILTGGLIVDPPLLRAARETLMVLRFGPEFSQELAQLVGSPDNEIGLWAIERLGALAGDSKLAANTLLPVASGASRIRAEAAAKVLAGLKNGQTMLVDALVAAEEEVGAQVLSTALNPLVASLGKRELKKLLDAGEKQLGKSFAVARRQLEPVRIADPEGWAKVLRAKAKAVGKKDPAKAEAIAELLGQSSVASSEDRFGAVLQRLQHQSLDLHPRARQRDTVLLVLERLHYEGFKVAEAILRDKKLSDEARYYVGVHFAEKAQFELKNIGAAVLEHLASQGRGKLAKAAKNKIKLLEL